jgi:hypothetical protein
MRRCALANVTKPCLYFEKSGKHNTAEVIETVMHRMGEGDISTIVVASTTGYTALEFSDALEGQNATLISVGETPLIREWGAEWPCLEPETKQELEGRGVVVADRIPYLLHSSVLDFSQWKAPSAEEILRESLYAFGQGLKVAVEVVLIAVASGFLEPYQDVIAVGGTSRGADTAIVVRATLPNHVFSQDADKRLIIREVLCKPL